jgi:TusA-related sulfurtransferase
MADVDLNSIQTANVVDARGVSCPGPLLEAKKGIGNVQIGQILEILSNDPTSREDIPKWANKVGHEYLGVLSVDGADRLFVKRQK